MSDLTENTQEKQEEDARHKMLREIEEKQSRKVYARHTKHQSTWFGLGMMGTIGWTVAIPTLLGVALGIWIDAHWSSPISWTLTLLIGGLLMGCVNAWLWIDREQKAMERERAEEERNVE
ncbi:MAG: AtpZ/AtpI family protein [Anaerolineae bacterium]|nr:AtpZ/AtpI family protein [Anaerolineae bacterium]